MSLDVISAYIREKRRVETSPVRALRAMVAMHEAWKQPVKNQPRRKGIPGRGWRVFCAHPDCIAMADRGSRFCFKHKLNGNPIAT